MMWQFSFRRESNLILLTFRDPSFKSSNKILDRHISIWEKFASEHYSWSHMSVLKKFIIKRMMNEWKAGTWNMSMVWNRKHRSKLKNLCVENISDLRYENHYPLGLSPEWHDINLNTVLICWRGETNLSSIACWGVINEFQMIVERLCVLK